MTDQWYYFANGRKLGPVSLGRLQQLAEEGVVRFESEVFREGMPDWVAAKEVPEIFSGGKACPGTVAPTPTYASSIEPDRQARRSDPASAKNYLPWVIGGIAAFLVICLTCGGGLLFLGKVREDEEAKKFVAKEKVAQKQQDEEHRKRLKEINQERDAAEKAIEREAALRKETERKIKSEIEKRNKEAEQQRLDILITTGVDVNKPHDPQALRPSEKTLHPK